MLDFFDVAISFWFYLDVRLFMRISYLALEFQQSLYRSNRSQLFYKIDVLKKILTSQKNTWVGVLSLQLYQKRDYDTGVFLQVLRNC